MKNVWLACLLSAFVVTVGNAQSTATESNYVVVIGAFTVKEHADVLSNQTKKQKLNTKVELNKSKNLYYVYTTQTSDRNTAVAERTKLRSSKQYKDAWIFNGTLGEVTKKEEPKPEPIIIEEPKVVPVVEAPKEEVMPVVKTLTAAELREEQIKKDVANQKMGMKKGDDMVLDHIYFFRDAAVLRPESRFQVDKLVQIMKENPALQIKIHGHTNGDAPGKIIMRKDESADFFSLDNTVEDYGSSKELSEQRADVIRDYLVANGVDKKRMSIKAEGGKKPIYDIDSDKAEANVRVEIEVVKSDQ